MGPYGLCLQAMLYLQMRLNESNIKEHATKVDEL